MSNLRSAIFACCVLLPALAGAGSDLSDADRKLLQDSGGWEYISMSDDRSGFPTAHTCFDGQPHENECSGKLTLTSGLRFTQTTRIQGQAVQRTGLYELNGNQLAFYDELETKDGPYTVTLNAEAKTLKLSMPQVNIQLLLEKEYRARMRGSARP